MGVQSTVVNIVLACVAFYFYQTRYVYKRPEYRRIDKPRTTYDYIVVGGGSAGSVMAARLSEDEARTVLLIEAGPSDIGHAQIDTPLRTSELPMSRFDWKDFTVPQNHSCLGMADRRAFLPRGKVLGGSSAINFLQWSRGHRLDYDKWAELGCEGWSYQQVLPYFLRSEDVLPKHLASTEGRGTSGPMKVTQVKDSKVADVFVEAAEALGYPSGDYNDGYQDGVSRAQCTIEHGERVSASRAYLWPVSGRRNLDILTDCLVLKVLTEKGQAIGVEFTCKARSGTEAVTTVRANLEVIVSAGVLGSPHLLLLSGIGPRSQLEALKIPVVSDLPVGENLQDHVKISLLVKMNLTTPGQFPPSFYNQLEYHLFGTGYMGSPAGPVAIGYFRTQDNLAQPDLEISLWDRTLDRQTLHSLGTFSPEVLQQWNLDNDDRGLLIFPTVLQPRSRGRVTLTSSTPSQHPEVDPRYLEEPDDVGVMVGGIRLVQKLLSTEPMQTIGARLGELPLLQACAGLGQDTDPFWRCYVRHLAMPAHHACGTCRMGPVGDVTAVTDPRLRVLGVDGLRVVDASVMPVIVSSGTNAPTIMIAERAVDMVKEDNS